MAGRALEGGFDRHVDGARKRGVFDGRKQPVCRRRSDVVDELLLIGDVDAVVVAEFGKAAIVEPLPAVP